MQRTSRFSGALPAPWGPCAHVVERGGPTTLPQRLQPPSLKITADEPQRQLSHVRRHERRLEVLRAPDSVARRDAPGTLVRDIRVRGGCHGEATFSGHSCQGDRNLMVRRAALIAIFASLA